MTKLKNVKCDGQLYIFFPWFYWFYSYIVITFLDKIFLNLLMILKRHFLNHAKMSFKLTFCKHLVFKQLI